MSNMISLALRYMRTRRVRTILTTLAIMFGVATWFATNSLFDSIETNLANIAQQPGEPDMSLTRIADEVFVGDSVLETIANVEGVAAVSGTFRRSFAMTIPGDTGMTIPGSEAANAPVITLVGIDPDTAPQVSDYSIAEGRFLEVNDKGAILMPASLARLGNIQVGNRFPLFTPGGLRLFTVVGLLEDGVSQPIQLIVSLADAQSAFDTPGQITAVDIALSPGADRDAVSQRLLDVLRTGYEVKLPQSTDQSLGRLSLSFFAMMALFVGAFLIFNTFRTAVVERQNDLAILRALGAERGQIIRVILIETLLQGVIGAVLGLILGAAFTILLIYLSKGSGWIPGRESLVTEFSPGTALFAASLGIGAALIAGYLPARAAGRVSPLAALRPSQQPDENIARWRIITGIVFLLLTVVLLFNGEETAIPGGFCVLVAAVFLAPTLIRPAVILLHPLIRILFPRECEIARGNILRQPRRAAVVVNTLMIGFAVFTASAALVLSFILFFEWLYTANYLSDVMLLPLGGETLVISDEALGADPSVADRLRTLPGVTAVSRLRSTQSQFQNARLEIRGIDPEFAGHLRPLQLYEGEHDEVVAAMSAGRAVFVNDRFVLRHDLGLGDTIQLDTPEMGVQNYTIVGVGDDIDIGAALPGMMMANSWLESDFGVVHDLILYVDIQDDADMVAVMTNIKEAVRDYPQLVPVELSAFLQGAMERARDTANFFYLMAVVVVVPSLLGLLNTLAINVMERKREIGLLRAIGGEQQQVQRVLLAETLYLAVSGALIGIVVGLGLSVSIIQFWDDALTTRIGMSPTLPLPEIAVGLVIGLLLTLLVSLFPARHAARLNIVQALHYE